MSVYLRVISRNALRRSSLRLIRLYSDRQVNKDATF
jgi:hypothetical protein